MKTLEGRDATREKIRIRDKHICQLCGLKWKLGTRRLDIHHLDAKKDKTRQYDRPEEFKNCITLCHSCHLSLPVHKNQMKEAARASRERKKSAREFEWAREKEKIKEQIKMPTAAQKRKWNVYGG